jgi:hypothetical protein
MSEQSRIDVFHSRGDDYSRAFQLFLAHTDQKAKARDWLARFVAAQPVRRALLDVGAGDGTVTSWLGPLYERVFAIEPNPALRAELAQRCPGVEVLPEALFEAVPPVAADLVLCSHVFYYVPAIDWLPALERLVSWAAPEGVAVVVLQHAESDCMKMVRHFLGHVFDLGELGRRFQIGRQDTHKVTIDVVPAHVTTPDLDTARAIAEFVLNTLPMPEPPLRRDLEDYVRSNFGVPGGGYRFSCTQSFLQVRRRAEAR